MFNVLQKTLDAHKSAVNKKEALFKTRQQARSGDPTDVPNTHTLLKNVFQRETYIGQKVQTDIKKKKWPY